MKLPDKLILRTSNGHGKKIEVERVRDGETFLSIIGGGGPEAYCYLSPSESVALVNFINKPRPREWMLEVEPGTTRIKGPYDASLRGEYVKVREVMDDE